MRALALSLLFVPIVAFAKDPPPPPAPVAPAAEVTDALVKLASKSAKSTLRAPHFAFTSTAAWDEPQSLDLAQFGLPEVAVPDKGKTLIDSADAETAVISTHL